MIFGGLEIVAGGYLIHRHYRKKDEKKQFEEEVQARRHNTFPGPTSYHNPQAYHQPQQQWPQQYQQPISPQQKYACYGTTPTPTPQPQFQAHCPPHPQQNTQPQCQPRPQPTHTQSFTIPRRPIPQRKPEIIIIQPLQRMDSFATLSRMPIANGSRPKDVPEDPPVPSNRRHASGLSPTTATTTHSPYGNAGFSVSTPAFGATTTSPPITYVMGTGYELEDRHSVDDNWETYEHGHHYAETTASTELGEQGPPPPPYTPRATT